MSVTAANHQTSLKLCVWGGGVKMARDCSAAFSRTLGVDKEKGGREREREEYKSTFTAVLINNSRVVCQIKNHQIWQRPHIRADASSEVIEACSQHRQRAIGRTDGQRAMEAILLCTWDSFVD